MAIGLGGDREAIGNGDALRRELLEHLAKRGVLAADQRNVLDANLAKEADEARAGLRLGFRCLIERSIVQGASPVSSPYLAEPLPPFKLRR